MRIHMKCTEKFNCYGCGVMIRSDQGWIDYNNGWWITIDEHDEPVCKNCFKVGDDDGFNRIVGTQKRD